MRTSEQIYSEIVILEKSYTDSKRGKIGKKV